MNLMRRFFIWLSPLLLLILFILTTQVRAESITVQQKSWRNQGMKSFYNATEHTETTGDTNKEVSEAYTFQVTLPGAAIEAITGWRGGGEIESWRYNRSVLGQSSAMITDLYNNPPATSGQYLTYLLDGAGLIPKTYAQGLTYSRLAPILPLWIVFRDIAYVLLVLVMLLIGLMIAFRAKINPQTVASVENSIPRVIVTILLITFSFPIAALIIDFMYVIIASGIGVIGHAVKQSGPAGLEAITKYSVQQAVNDYTTGGFITLFSKTMAPASQFATTSTYTGGAGALIGGILGTIFFTPGIGTAIGAGLGSIAGGLIGLVDPSQTGVPGLQVFSPILILFLLVVLLFAVFRIFFILLTNYIQILISIIFAPLILLINAVPGRNTFSFWWKGLVANMLSFVITALMLYLGWAIASLITTESFWTPPFIMQGAGMSQISVALISLGMVLLIPQMISMVKNALGVKSLFQVGPSMIFAPVVGGAGQGLNIVGQFHQASMGLNALRKFSPFKKSEETAK